MDVTEIQNEIRLFIEREMLDDQPGLDVQTPLLEWGILDSLKMTELVAFIEKHFEINLLPEDVSATHFGNIQAISNLVVERMNRCKNVAA